MKKAFLLLFTTLLLGCDKKYESVDFLEPQPGETPNETRFGKNYRGTYNGADNAQLVIEDDKILKVKRYTILFSKNDVDSTFDGDRNNEEELRNFYEKQNIKIITVSKDSISGLYQSIDTVFAISENQVCRALKGSYFLSYKNGSGKWKVQRLDLEKNRLSISMLMPRDSLFHLLPVQDKSVIKENGEVVAYQMKPTKKELKKLIKDNSFEEYEVWIKEQ